MDELIDDFESITSMLKSRGFREQTIKKYWRYWNKLKSYMNENGINSYSPVTGIMFLSDVYGITIFNGLKREQKWIVRSVNHLNNYLEFGSIFPGGPKTSMTKSLLRFGSILESFKANQQKQSSISEKSLYAYDKHIGKFLLYLENLGVEDISAITPKHVHEMCKLATQYSESMAYNMSCTLRVFLRQLHKDGVTGTDLSVIIPSFAYSRKSKLPSTLMADEKEALLSNIDRSSGLGKRDYAIILIACRLGLRSGDIRGLRFSDVHWERNTIEIVTQKTGKSLTLPLLEDVGGALVDYIKYSRPVTDSQVIFQTCAAPIKPLSAPAVSSIVKSRAGKASINTAPGRRLGPHLLRNTLASALLAEQVPLAEIAGILAHSTIQTTQRYYLRIDTKQLRMCALDVPLLSWELPEEVF